MTLDNYPNLHRGCGRNATPDIVPLEQAVEAVGEEIGVLPSELRARLGEVAGDGDVGGLLQRLREVVDEHIQNGNPKNIAELREAVDEVLAASGVGGNKKIALRLHTMTAVSHLPINQEK